ncbi:MAG: class I SAM-dependent methyltransferase [Phycisphaerales bacterium]
MAGGLDKAVRKTRREVKRVFIRLGLAQPYQEEFFDGFAEVARDSARVIVPLVMDLVRPTSVADVGCGLGIWLREFADAGVSDYRGFDGDYVRRDRLVIPVESFTPTDLAAGVKSDRRFDLAVSLEVAEHLPEASADRFVESLTKLAPVVLFSAAIPKQGGTGHINEQWPAYWAEKFATRGFVAVDCVRPAVWTNAKVAWWYAQNTVLYVERSRLATLPKVASAVERQPAGGGLPLALVHPHPYERVARRAGR